jgi:hypothetical protein
MTITVISSAPEKALSEVYQSCVAGTAVLLQALRTLAAGKFVARREH